MTPLSQKCGEKQEGSAFKVGPHLSFLKPFQYEETSCIGTPKELSIHFSLVNYGLVWKTNNIDSPYMKNIFTTKSNEKIRPHHIIVRHHNTAT